MYDVLTRISTVTKIKCILSKGKCVSHASVGHHIKDRQTAGWREWTHSQLVYHKNDFKSDSLTEAAVRTKVNLFFINLPHVTIIQLLTVWGTCMSVVKY